MSRQYFIDLATDKKRDAVAGLLKILLFVLSLIYGAAVAVISFLYSRGILNPKKSKCKVISVGNVTWGGTGKTPLVIHIASELGHERRVAVLMRGYGKDERHLSKEKLDGVPVIVGRDRVRSSRDAEKMGIEVLVLDDGFQHRRLARDVDIVAIDSGNPFGNGALVPRGILREPSDSLVRAQVFILTNADEYNVPLLRMKLSRLNPRAQIFESSYKVISLKASDGSSIGLDSIKGARIAGLCAIGNPQSFYRTLVGAGARIELEIAFPDHHDYTLRDLDGVAKKCGSLGITTVVTTEKDMVKLKILRHCERAEDKAFSCERSEAGSNLQNVGAVREPPLQMQNYSLRLLSLEVEPQIKEKEKFFAGLRSLLNR